MHLIELRLAQVGFYGGVYFELVLAVCCVGRFVHLLIGNLFVKRSFWIVDRLALATLQIIRRYLLFVEMDGSGRAVPIHSLLHRLNLPLSSVLLVQQVLVGAEEF